MKMNKLKNNFWQKVGEEQSSQLQSHLITSLPVFIRQRNSLLKINVFHNGLILFIMPQGPDVSRC